MFEAINMLSVIPKNKQVNITFHLLEGARNMLIVYNVMFIYRL